MNRTATAQRAGFATHRPPMPALPLALVVAALLAGPAAAQGRVDRPSQRPLELPGYVPPQPGRVLPEVVIPQTPSLGGLAAGRSFPVRQVVVEGSTVLTPQQLRDIVAPYESRDLTYSELEALRLAITQAYIERGFVTSGARIPDQDVGGGVVRIDVIEGVLAEVVVGTDGRLSTRGIERRLARGAGGVVNVFELEEQLQLLQQRPQIGKVDAVLLPGQRPGESRLQVTLHEATPYLFEASYANQENPAIGEESARGEVRHLNLLGFGDEIMANYRESDGFEQAEGAYRLPLGSRGTSLELRGYTSESVIIDPAFREFDITSEAETLAVTLRQEVYRTLGATIEVYAAGEKRTSQTELLGVGFSFTPGPHEGETRLGVARIGTEATWRGASQVFAARVQGSFGMDWFDPTRNSEPGVPDAEFGAALLQAQWATRLPWLGAQLLARADAQLAADPLFGLEQFAIGGAATVRGFVESALVRDNGVIASLEARVPLLQGSSTRPRVELAPFVDWGRGWNQDGSSRGAEEELSGAGVGLRFSWRWLSGEVYWAEDLNSVGRGAVAEALREDLHFALRVRWPQ